MLECATVALDADPANEDALTFKSMADAGLNQTDNRTPESSSDRKSQSPSSTVLDSTAPSSFASGRYSVSKFLGEGGKKKSLPGSRQHT